MLMSYTVLFSVICAIMYLLYYMKQDKHRRILYLVLCAIQVYYLLQVLAHGSRGPILSIFIFLVLNYFFAPKSNIDFKRNNSFSKFLIVMTLLLIVMILFQNNLVQIVYNFTTKYNINIRIINKMYFLIRNADVSNGRINIYLYALTGFINSPVFGNGIDMFFENTGIIYPHNLFLQLAYDGGMFLLCIVMIPVINASVKILKTNDKDLLIPWLVLFSSSVPGLMVSSDVWTKYIFWFFVAFCIFSIHKLNSQKNYRLL